MIKYKKVLTQSLIKALLDEQQCPLKTKMNYIDHTLKDHATEAMTKGTFFEYLCLGNANKQGEIITDLPRKRSGDKTVDQQRIESQVKNFEDMCKQNSVEILERGIDIVVDHPDMEDVSLKGTLDMVGEMSLDESINSTMFIGDLKLTGDIHNTEGDFGWGSPEKMDLLQAIFYSYIFKLETDQNAAFVYFVFDYKPVPEYKLLKVKMTALRIAEMKESIRKAASLIDMYDESEWPTKRAFKNCNTCSFSSQCPATLNKKLIEEI